MYQPTSEQQRVILAMLHNSAQFPGRIGYRFYYTKSGELAFYPQHSDPSDPSRWINHDIGRIDPFGNVFHRDRDIVDELEQIAREAPWEQVAVVSEA